MSKIIAIAMHKGGVGKTTSAVNISSGLAINKKRTLLIDLDPQSNASVSFNIANPDRDIYGALKNKYDLPIIKIKDNLDIVPASLDLSAAEVELITEVGREVLLKRKLEKIYNNYDYILIDCPPSLGLLTLNALVAADSVLIPLQAQYLALHGMTKLMDIINKVKLSGLNSSLSIEGLFLTLYDDRQVLNKTILKTIRNNFQGNIFKTNIRKNIALAEAPYKGMDIFTYDGTSNGAKDYYNLVNEILKGKNEKTI